ncbi:hypothetical protein B1R94_28950 [Mycolicibacterium litorale]|nr:hypothetical protein B1R94_28950 [Mycolicibacterium litorale]
MLRWATARSSACLGRSDIGSLEVGKQADLALLTLDGVHFSGSHYLLAPHRVSGSSAPSRGDRRLNHVAARGQFCGRSVMMTAGGSPVCRPRSSAVRTFRGGQGRSPWSL